MNESAMIELLEDIEKIRCSVSDLLIDSDENGAFFDEMKEIQKSKGVVLSPECKDILACILEYPSPGPTLENITHMLNNKHEKPPGFFRSDLRGVPVPYLNRLMGIGLIKINGYSPQTGFVQWGIY